VELVVVAEVGRFLIYKQEVDLYCPLVKYDKPK
jgi:hypothetical protein